MIWATVSSSSCFCQLCRASPSLAAKNIINLISGLAIWWCPCVESSLVLEKSVCYDQWILLAKLLAFAPLHFVLQSQTCLLLQVSLDFLLFHSSPLRWKLMMVWKCCTQYASKFGKLSSGRRTGKGQFSFQSLRNAMLKNAQTTTQLHSFHMLVK